MVGWLDGWMDGRVADGSKRVEGVMGDIYKFLSFSFLFLPSFCLAVGIGYAGVMNEML